MPKDKAPSHNDMMLRMTEYQTLRTILNRTAWSEPTFNQLKLRRDQLEAELVNWMLSRTE